ncbi:MAG: hypothetical protein ACOYON_14275 [Fimbriimonas sp.]
MDPVEFAKSALESGTRLNLIGDLSAARQQEVRIRFGWDIESTRITITEQIAYKITHKSEEGRQKLDPMEVSLIKLVINEGQMLEPNKKVENRAVFEQASPYGLYRVVVSHLEKSGGTPTHELRVVTAFRLGKPREGQSGG